mmetsp:Transcript_108365/g.271614  ORF Transcript_108365/g.271614 Transcript_108365/m.271614 type:complete len:228 (-) Transcript_108365:40-723(-)
MMIPPVYHKQLLQVPPPRAPRILRLVYRSHQPNCGRGAGATLAAGHVHAAVRALSCNCLLSTAKPPLQHQVCGFQWLPWTKPSLQRPAMQRHSRLARTCWRPQLMKPMSGTACRRWLPGSCHCRIGTGEGHIQWRRRHHLVLRADARLFFRQTVTCPSLRMLYLRPQPARAQKRRPHQSGPSLQVLSRQPSALHSHRATHHRAEAGGPCGAVHRRCQPSPRCPRRSL